MRPPGVPGCAYVTFKSVRDASRCYEAMCDALPWRERGSPLQLTFVATQVYPPNMPQRPQVSADLGRSAGAFGASLGQQRGGMNLQVKARAASLAVHIPYAQPALSAELLLLSLPRCVPACSARPTMCGWRGWAAPRMRQRCCGAARRGASRRQSIFSRWGQAGQCAAVLIHL